MSFIEKTNLEVVTEKLNAVKNQMRENIDLALEKGEQLEHLVEKTEDLQQGAGVFKDRAKKTKNKLWWENIKMKLCMVAIAVSILVIIISVAVIMSSNSSNNSDNHKRKLTTLFFSADLVDLIKINLLHPTYRNFYRVEKMLRK